MLSKMAVGGWMAIDFFVGAFTMGRRVVDTLGTLGNDITTLPLTAALTRGP